MKVDDHVIGSTDARVTIVEYGDYECHYCARAYLVLQVVLGELGNDVRYVFRNFPVRSIHPNAMTAAEAAESVAVHAGESAFWQMHSMLFENQDALEVDDLLAYAEAAGAPIADLASDLTTGAMRTRVERDIRLAMLEEIHGTPALFLNGRRFTGDWTCADAFTAALTAAADERALH